MNHTSVPKIGILTYHFSTHNYGAVLQTYASLEILKNLGYQTKVINLLPNKKPGIYKCIKQFINSLITGSIEFEKFRKKYFDLTSKFYHGDDLRCLNSLFDIYYVGSDQVWRASLSKENLIHYFFDFADNDKIKVAYGASFGTSNWEGDLSVTNIIKPLLRRFSAVGVREKDGVEICRKVFDVEAIHVLDPTLLLNVNDYDKINKRSISLNGHKYIGYYLIQDKEAKCYLSHTIFEQTNLKVINLFGKSKFILGYQYFRFNSVRDWLYGIKNASVIITDSYHCVIFSILFKKEFICIPNKKGGISRVEGLLKGLELLDRFCTPEKVDFNHFLATPIDYNKVFSKLDILKQESIEFLQSALRVNF